MHETTLFLVDASGFLYSAYHAIKAMSRSDGVATNALFGFISSVEKLIKSFNPLHIAIVYDGPQNTEKRRQIYPAYKANRAAMPEDLPHQLQLSRSYCDLRGLSRLEAKGYEADDVIATAVKWAEEHGYNVFICSSDKDLYQLVNKKVNIIDIRKEQKIIDEAAVFERFGVLPNQVRDYLSLLGDSSDNIPGLPGFGPKKSAQLLGLVGSLDRLLQEPSLAGSAKQQALIEEYREQLKLSQKLITLEQEVPEELLPHSFSLENFAIKSIDSKALMGFYKEQEFNTFAKTLQAQQPLDEEKKREKVSYQLIDDEKSLQELLEKLRAYEEICFDTETTSVKPLEAQLAGIGLAFKEKESYYLPCNGRLGLERIIKALTPIFEDPTKKFIGHNLKYDLHVLQNYGIEVAYCHFDTLLASYLLEAHRRTHNLDDLTLDLFDHEKISIESLLGKGKTQCTMLEVEIEKVCDYCCEDVDYTFRLKQLFEKRVVERGFETLFYQLEMPLMRVLQKIERQGIYLNKELLAKLGLLLKEELIALQNKAYQQAGCPFNLNSPVQIGELFEQMGIKTGKKTKRGLPATGAEELEKVKELYPIADTICQYRILEKLRSTYVETLPDCINSKTGRIHCTFNQSGAATGRLSSHDPNLQNIPVRTQLGLEIRAAFCPQKRGWSFLSADYSQIELRLLAHMCGDETLVRAFNHGEDIHTHTASAVFEVPIDQVTSQMRYRAKAVNFGLIYGQQAFGLSQTIGVKVAEADAFIKNYFARYPRVKEFLEQCKELARKEGKTKTLFGRERLLPEINSSNGMLRSASERLAVNTPIQGTAADLIKMAMLAIEEKMTQSSSNAMMLLQIHDELIFEVPDDEIEQLMPIVRSEMEGVMKLKVPLVVDVACGKSWREC